jgi:hypothetical protein
MFDALTELAKSIAGIVTSAIEGDWAGLAGNIVGTVRDSIGVGVLRTGGRFLRHRAVGGVAAPSTAHAARRTAPTSPSRAMWAPSGVAGTSVVS